MFVIAAQSLTGCLGIPIDPNAPESEQWKLLMPPAVVDKVQTDAGVLITSPRPGKLIRVERSDMANITFRIVVARQNIDGLTARFFVNRPRPCPKTNTLCGSITRSKEIPFEGSVYRFFERDIPFPLNPEPRCDRVDMYISTRFRSEDAIYDLQNEPIRTGDLVHVRWFVAVNGSTRGDAPTLAQCWPPDDDSP